MLLNVNEFLCHRCDTGCIFKPPLGPPPHGGAGVSELDETTNATTWMLSLWQADLRSAELCHGNQERNLLLFFSVPDESCLINISSDVLLQ